MVKLAKGAKAQAKPKKAAPPPPKDMEDSEEDEDMEEDDSSDEMEVPVKKTPAKKTTTPAKATPAKKAATPAKPVITPGKKGTPAGAKNGKQAKKQESEDEEEDSDEESEEEQKPAKTKPVAKKEESDEDEEEESEDEKPVTKRTPAKKPPAKVADTKKAAVKKQESEDEESEEDDDDEEEEPMEAEPVGKGKAPAKADDDDDEEDDDEEDDDDDDDEEEETTKESSKRKKDMPKNKNIPEAKKQKTDAASEGLSVFVGNLNSSKDFEELKDALRKFFTKNDLSVQDIRIGSSKKFGYVDFSSEEEVEKALNLSGGKIHGSEVKIEKAMTFDKNKVVENKKERDARTLFVKNIPYSTTTEDLQDIFENAKDIRIPVGKDGASKGIAYVEFNTEAEAEKVLEEKQGAEMEGRSLFIDFTGDKSQSSAVRRAGESKTLVVNNLSYSATEESLQEVFEKATSIRIPQNQGRSKGGLSEDTTEETLKEAFDGSVGARIVTDRETGASKGFGFVDFSTAEDAKAAKEAMEDGEIDGNKVTLDFAKPKGDNQRGGRGGFGRGGGFRGGRGGFGGRGGGRGGFGGKGGGRGRGGFGGRGGGGFRGGNHGQGKKIKFD